MQRNEKPISENSVRLIKSALKKLQSKLAAQSLSNAEPFPLAKLPKDILGEIMQHLPPYAIARMQRVNKMFYTAASEALLKPNRVLNILTTYPAKEVVAFARMFRQKDQYRTLEREFFRNQDALSVELYLIYALTTDDNKKINYDILAKKRAAYLNNHIANSKLQTFILNEFQKIAKTCYSKEDEERAILLPGLLLKEYFHQKPQMNISEFKEFAMYLFVFALESLLVKLPANALTEKAKPISTKQSFGLFDQSTIESIIKNFIYLQENDALSYKQTLSVELVSSLEQTEVKIREVAIKLSQAFIPVDVLHDAILYQHENRKGNFAQAKLIIEKIAEKLSQNSNLYVTLAGMSIDGLESGNLLNGSDLKLDHMNLCNCSFKNLTLSSLNLSNSDCTNVWFDNIKSCNTTFVNVYAQNATLRHVSFDNCIIQQGRFTGIKIIDVSISKPRLLPHASLLADAKEITNLKYVRAFADAESSTVKIKLDHHSLFIPRIFFARENDLCKYINDLKSMINLSADDLCKIEHCIVAVTAKYNISIQGLVEVLQENCSMFKFFGKRSTNDSRATYLEKDSNENAVSENLEIEYIGCGEDKDEEGQEKNLESVADHEESQSRKNYCSIQ